MREEILGSNELWLPDFVELILEMVRMEDKDDEEEGAILKLLLKQTAFRRVQDESTSESTDRVSDKRIILALLARFYCYLQVIRNSAIVCVASGCSCGDCDTS